MAALEPISSIETTSMVSTISFTSIPQTYKHLKLILDTTAGITDFAGVSMRMGDTSLVTSATYSYVAIINDGAAAKCNVDNAYTMLYGSVINGSAAFMEMWTIYNYTNTNMWKNVLCQGGEKAQYINTTFSMLRTTSAITQIQLNAGAASFNSACRATLFGVRG